MLIHGKLVRLTRPQDEGNGYAMFWFLVTEDIEYNDKHLPGGHPYGNSRYPA